MHSGIPVFTNARMDHTPETLEQNRSSIQALLAFPRE
jgi:hypothetical protein